MPFDPDFGSCDVLKWSSEPFIHEEEDDSDFWEDQEEDEQLVLDCGTPGCLMPGYHFRSECHTAKDLQQHYEDEGIPANRPTGFDIPQSVAVCPECGAQLHVEFEEWETETGKPTYEGMDVSCYEEDFDNPETSHRHWQCDWQPVINEVWKYVKE